MPWFKVDKGIKPMLSVVKYEKCPVCGMPLTDEMVCDYCNWGNRKK